MGQTGALLIQSEENKERWRNGRKGDREGGKARREGGNVFSSETEITLVGINRRSLYPCTEYLERLGCMAYVEFFSLFWVLLFLLKHFTLWQLQIKFSKEHCNRSRTSRELKPGPRGI